MQIGQLQKIVGYLAGTNLSTKVILRTAFICRIFEEIISKTSLITLTGLSPVVTKNETRRYQFLTIESHDKVKQLERLAAEQPSVLLEK